MWLIWLWLKFIIFSFLNSKIGSILLILLWLKSIYSVFWAFVKALFNFVIVLCGYDILWIFAAYFRIGSYFRGPGWEPPQLKYWIITVNFVLLYRYLNNGHHKQHLIIKYISLYFIYMVKLTRIDLLQIVSNWFAISYIYIVILMLPKLQQSSLAQSLRRDNPATLIQSKQ